MSHTPGPWKAELDIEAQATYITSTESDNIAMISDTANDNLDPKTRTANARLIAAAPELLAALKRIVAILPDGNSPSHLQAKRAIAQAEGQA